MADTQPTTTSVVLATTEAVLKALPDLDPKKAADTAGYVFGAIEDTLIVLITEQQAAMAIDTNGGNLACAETHAAMAGELRRVLATLQALRVMDPLLGPDGQPKPRGQQ